MSNQSSFFGGMDLLDGMPARQAGMILFAIEGRTAQLVAQSRQALATHLTEKAAAQKEKEFLSAIGQGRELPLQPTIQEIERFVPEWSGLAPQDDRHRAALAQKLGEKFRFRRRDVPALRKALGLDADGVREAYEGRFQEPLDAIYVQTVPVAEELRWLRSRLENRLERMPPFWTAFSLTLTEVIGASILALPIALAGIGPALGVALLVILGLVNIVTVMSIVEAITRNGNMRYGTAYFGTLVADYLGHPGSIVLGPALSILNMLTLMAFYFGIAVTLADSTGISPMLWTALAFIVAIYYLRRETLDATVASALMIGMANIVIILLLCALAFPHIRIEYLAQTSLSFTGEAILDPAVLGLVFGVALVAYFGHTSAGNAAKVVLRRDPGGKALMWGNVTAIGAAIALYSLWVIAVNGAISPGTLNAETGTALSPLAAKVGNSVSILGVVYVVLAMGIGSIHVSYGLYYQMREFLPFRKKPTQRFMAGVAPIVALALLVEWMLLTGRESFAGILGFMGALLLPILGGIFPILMLLASRRKGEYLPQLALDFLDHPAVLAAIYLVYLCGVFVYGLFIWDQPYQRFMAVGVGLLLLIVTYLVAKQGAFNSRAVIELRVVESDAGEYATIAAVDRGKPLAGVFHWRYGDREQPSAGAEVEISRFDRLEAVTVDFPVLLSKEMKVWLHRVTPEGDSRPISAAVRIDNGSIASIELDPSSGQIIFPVTPPVNGLEIKPGR